jgi:DNA-binding response OmpR family regulator
MSKILVVDDEREMVNTLRISLESHNYKVVEAYTGDGAIRKARKETPDLILLIRPNASRYDWL